jgi:hypothetical protein
MLTLVLDERERMLSKALPGTVVTYDTATKTCTVRPGVHRLVMSTSDFDDDEIEELPAIPNVPVLWPQGRGFAFTPSVGLLPGDPVLLICCDRDISGWLETGVPSAPDDARAHSWSSAVAIPGLVPATYVNVLTDALALASKMDAMFRPLALLSAATDPASTMALVNAILAAVKLSYPTALSSCASAVAKVSE